MANLTDIDTQVQPFFAIRSLDTFLPNLIQIVLVIGALAALLFLFWGGVSYITSGGDKEATKAAREKITNAVIGLAILAIVWVLWRLIVYFLGLSPGFRGPFRIQIPTP
ncbi:MAG: hypothetical protein A2786_00015 [Candidatus Chisholmbacteria bacterium RIFCSPHIGHO2_01_FULL_52_32]|uniref:Uncharacterized protein n=1 Tax=Candidatus Chisholmbacteria bacterium RIFCSPHIGHO2_01_FULL_52_32 TaxID=1797591 RepID=A0A1G1VQE7_9BACT|nr:MAG: hypothetical protein A2786_00015 [Candidatus Chisholmbacteria bacterium RIFCSPHIGHO2_01_FULL_52_32]